MEGLNMAKAITHIEKEIPNPVQEQAQAIEDLLKATADSREALVVFLDIIKELHEAGILDIVQGMLKARHQVGVIAVQTLNQPAMHRVIKNGINTMQFLGKLEPKQLETLMGGITKGLEKSAERIESNKTEGIWSMAKSLRDPHVNVTVNSMIDFLRGMGEALNETNKRVH
jgi:uncharacterized protein YjgD (DUF1641 family)